MDRSHRRWFGRGRTRALLTLGIIASLGAVGTSAYWTDTATIAGGSITAGTMDLQVAKTAAGPWNSTATGSPANADWTDSDIAVANMVPGGSQAFSLAVQNVGDANFKFSGSVTQGASTAWGFSGNPITVQLYRGGTVTNSTSFPPSGTCAGGTSLGAATTVTGTASPLITTPEPLTHGTTEALCLVVAMVPTADNSNQGKQGQLQLRLDASEVTS